MKSIKEKSKEDIEKFQKVKEEEYKREYAKVSIIRLV